MASLRRRFRNRVSEPFVGEVRGRGRATGTTTLFAALNMTTSEVIGKTDSKHRH